MYDVYKVRKDFPMLDGTKKMQGKNLVFLDNASTTFKPQRVIDAMTEYYTTFTANSHRGDYDLLYNMDVKVSEARKAIAKFINSEENEVVFTSGDTASINLVAFGYALKFLKKDDEILISETEHASNVIPWFKVAQMTGAKVKYIPLDENNKITPENVKKVVCSATKICSVAQVGNVLAHEVDVKNIAKIVHEVGGIMVVDGAQSVPHMKIDFKDLDCDFLAFSAHKMCGPTGIGALVGKYDLLDSMDAVFGGGGMNIGFSTNGTCVALNPPAKFEAGTMNLSGILGFKAAVEYLEEIGMDNVHKHDQELFDYAMSKLEDNENVIIYNKTSRNGIITFNVKNVFSQDEATLLNHKGIAVRSGQHCAKMIDEAIGTNATVRASFYLYTTKEDVDALVDALNEGGDILDAYFN
ncbi:MAG: cysteine desulfurase [Bacilli bacterium]|nr:cysteine desulfurase [Bacilli bacterium]